MWFVTWVCAVSSVLGLWVFGFPSCCDCGWLCTSLAVGCCLVYYCVVASGGLVALIVVALCICCCLHWFVVVDLVVTVLF